ncbi:MAG: phosphotransferase, partial [Waterburya sp.]
DHSSQHYEYILETAYRLFDRTKDESWLTKLDNLLNETFSNGVESRSISFYRGEFSYIQAENSRGHLLSIKYCDNSIKYFSEAIDMPTNYGVKEEHIFAKRGSAYFLKYRLLYELNDFEDEQLLESSISDFGEVGAHASSLGGTSLPSALFFRASHLKKKKLFLDALTDLERAKSLYDPASPFPEAHDVQERVKSQIAEIHVWLGIELDDIDLVRRGISDLCTMDKEKDPSIAAMGSGCRFLLNKDSLLSDIELFIKVINFIETQLKNRQMPPDARRFALSYAAGLRLDIFKQRQVAFPVEELQHIYELYENAISADNVLGPAELYSRAGNTALLLAKQQVLQGRRKQAIGFLKDSYKFLEKSLEFGLQRSEAFSEVSAYSFLGETYTRLYAQESKPEYASKAIDYFTKSQDLGNQSPELIGLLADIYYRRGRLNKLRNPEKSISDLKESIRLKLQAREGGAAVFRENFSVTANAYIFLWELEGTDEHLLNSIENICEALRIDESWPWSYFQMSEAIERVQDTFLLSLMIDTGLCNRSFPSLDNSYAWIKVGCEKAIENKEFKPRILGGKSDVYLLDDPHRLLSKTLILKPNNRQNAEKEKAATERLKNFLRDRQAPNYLDLPEPLSIIDVDHPKWDVIYAMRFSDGSDLGSLTISEADNTENKSWSLYEKTLDFLAYFHVYWAQQENQTKKRVTFKKSLAKKIGDQWKNLLGYEERNELEGLLWTIEETVALNLPVVKKKDAHPENWLITPEQKVVMLDLEASVSLPILFEVAQLIEDYPFVEVSQEGWIQRKQLCDRYLDKMKELEFPIQRAVVFDTTYSSFALFRAAFGFARLANQQRNPKAPVQSSSALHVSNERSLHFQRIIEFIAQTGETSDLKACANWLYAKVLI